MHGLGATRSSLKADHLLQTPDTFIRTPLPGAEDVQFIVHAAPRLGASFTMMTAEFAEGGSLGDPHRQSQRFLYVLEGELHALWQGPGNVQDRVQDNDSPHGEFHRTLRPGSFLYLPEGTPHSIEAVSAARAVLIEKPLEQPDIAVENTEVWFGEEPELPSAPLDGDEALQVRRMMPDGINWDFAVNTMTYDPGASLAMVEVHVMEHGLLMLEGGGIYRLGDHWYPVTAGDFIWMASYCPQWFGALGKTPAKYLIYKDWYRHPLGA